MAHLKRRIEKRSQRDEIALRVEELDVQLDHFFLAELKPTLERARQARRADGGQARGLRRRTRGRL